MFVFSSFPLGADRKVLILQYLISKVFKENELADHACLTFSCDPVGQAAHCAEPFPLKQSFQAAASWGCLLPTLAIHLYFTAGVKG